MKNMYLQQKIKDKGKKVTLIVESWGFCEPHRTDQYLIDK